MKLNHINRHSLLKIAIDAVIWIIITYIAFYFRLEGGIVYYFDDICKLSLLIVPVKILLVIFNGHYHSSWRYSTLYDFAFPALSVISFTFFYYLAIIAIPAFRFVPRTVPAIDAVLALISFFFIRIAAQVVLRRKKSMSRYPRERKNQRKVIIAGAGESGTMIAKEMLRHPEMGMSPVGFLDDDKNKKNQTIAGIPVLGGISELENTVKKYNVEEVIIAMPSESGQTIRNVVEQANAVNLSYRTIPGLCDLISGHVSINQLRNVQVEDLLRRQPVELNTDKIEEYIKGKRVLVTGAGGSIGSELVRQLTRFYPERLIMVGRGENTIHEMVRECERHFAFIKKDVKIADIRDEISMKQIFQQTRPEVVFHAAAHKHVYLMESNPSQAIFNNIGGTKNLTDLALQYDVEFFVNVSTDKAINPTSIMGASKRIAEYIVHQASQKVDSDRYFVSVRFGNVLGSRGSVVPIFKDQIQKGGPVTITHPEMKRFFMTIPEASQLVLQAGALKINGAIFVLDMGEPVKIVDMAKDLILLSGLEPEVDIKIKYTGIKPGEKLYEELLTAEEGTDMTMHEKIYIARNNEENKHLDKHIDKLFKAAHTGDVQAIRNTIKTIVSTYVNETAIPD